MAILTQIQSPEVQIGDEVSRSNGYFNPIPYVMQYKYDDFISVDLNGSNTRVTLSAIPPVNKYNLGDKISIFGGPYNGKEVGTVGVIAGDQLTFQSGGIFFRGTAAGILFNSTKEKFFRVEIQLVDTVNFYPLDEGTISAFYPRVDGKIFLDPSNELQKYFYRMVINYLSTIVIKQPSSISYVLQYRISINGVAQAWQLWPNDWIGNPSQKQLLEPFGSNLFEYTIKECAGGVIDDNPQLLNWHFVSDLSSWSQLEAGAGWSWGAGATGYSANALTIINDATPTSQVISNINGKNADAITLQAFIGFAQSFVTPGVTSATLEVLGWNDAAPGVYTVLDSHVFNVADVLFHTELITFNLPAGAWDHLAFRGSKVLPGSWSFRICNAWKQLEYQFQNPEFVGSLTPWLQLGEINGAFEKWNYDNIRQAAASAFNVTKQFLYQDVGMLAPLTVEIDLTRGPGFPNQGTGTVQIVGIKDSDTWEEAGTQYDILWTQVLTNVAPLDQDFVVPLNFVGGATYYQALGVYWLGSTTSETLYVKRFEKQVAPVGGCILTPAKWATRRKNLFIYDAMPQPLSIMLETTQATRSFIVRENYLDINGSLLFTQSTAVDAQIDASGLYTYMVRPPNSNYAKVSVFIEEAGNQVSETIILQKVCINKKAVFVEWINSLGGTELYGFFISQGVNINAEDLPAFERAPDDIEVASGVLFKNKAANKFTILLTDEQVKTEDLPALHEMKSSQQIRLIRNNLQDGIFVASVSQESTYDTRNKVTTFTVEYELPTDYNPAFNIK